MIEKVIASETTGSSKKDETWFTSSEGRLESLLNVTGPDK